MIMIYLIAFFVILESFKIIQSSLMTVIDLESHNWPEQPSVPPWYWYSLTSKIKIENSKKIHIFEIFKYSKFFLGIKRNWTEDRNKWNYWPVYWSYRRKLMVSQKYFFFTAWYAAVSRWAILYHTVWHGISRFDIELLIYLYLMVQFDDFLIDLWTDLGWFWVGEDSKMVPIIIKSNVS